MVFHAPKSNAEHIWSKLGRREVTGSIPVSSRFAYFVGGDVEFKSHNVFRGVPVSQLAGRELYGGSSPPWHVISKVHHIGGKPCQIITPTF